MRIQVAYTPDGKLVAGTSLEQSGPARCRIAPADHYVLGEFDLRPEHAVLEPAELWGRITIDVSVSEHRIVVRD
jgi:hypothetical protein